MDYEKLTILNRIKRWLFNQPECATSDEWYRYDSETSKKYPTLYFILDTIPRIYRRWWFQNITERKHDLIAKYKKVHHIILDINRFPVHSSTKKNQYKKKYWNYSPNIKMLHANFQVLVNIYENLDHEIIEYRKTLSKNHKIAWTEFEFLYKWWAIDRPLRNINSPQLSDFEGLVDNFWGIDENGIKNEEKPAYLDYKAALLIIQKLRDTYDIEDKEMLLKLITYSEFLF